MANQTTNIDLIAVNQAQKEVLVNELLDAASPATAYGRRALTTVGLTWGYYGGVVPVADSPTEIANGTVLLTASSTNYIYRDANGAVQVTTSFSTDWPGPLPNSEVALYEVVTDTDSVTDYTDLRLASGMQGVAGVSSGIIPQNSQSGDYTTIAGDSGSHILHPSADTTPRTFTIDSNAKVPYSIGTAITFINQNGAGSLTIAISSDTMRLAGDGSTGSRTLAANGVATAIKITSTEWIISGTGLS